MAAVIERLREGVTCIGIVDVREAVILRDDGGREEHGQQANE
jgi:hypothetical protein